MSAINEIRELPEAAGRLGYEISEVGYLDGPFCDSYDTIGNSIFTLIDQNPEQVDIIEKTIIAVCGYGFDSLKDRMEKHKENWDSIK